MKNIVKFFHYKTYLFKKFFKLPENYNLYLHDKHVNNYKLFEKLDKITNKIAHLKRKLCKTIKTQAFIFHFN